MQKIVVLLLGWLCAVSVAMAQLVPIEYEEYQGLDPMIDSTGITHILTKGYDAISDNEFAILSSKLRTMSKLYVVFDTTVISLAAYPQDSLDISWNAIDTLYIEIRQGFEALEQQYGMVTLKRIFPQYNSGKYSQHFYLKFSQYVPVDSILMRVDALPYTSAGFMHYPAKELYVPNDRGMKAGTSLAEIQYPAHFSDQDYPPYFHKRGFLWNCYAMNTPMAWEITTGTSSTVIVARDAFRNFDPEFPDMIMKTMAGSTGNFIRVTAATIGDGVTGVTTPFIGEDHGSQVLHMAVAKGDNDGPAGGEGMVGICYDCNAMGVTVEYASSSTATCARPLDILPDWETLIDLDTDLSTNGTIQRTSVLNISYVWIGKIPESIFKAGIIVVAAAGNEIASTNANGEFVPSDYYTSAYNYTTTNSLLDYKPIAVSATRDGTFRSVTSCNVVEGNAGRFIVGDEHFIPGWNYAPGTDKFNMDTNPVTRATARHSAFIDVAAPGNDLLMGVDGRCSTTASWYQSYHYAPNWGGTSMSTPQVAGICGLMVSINKYLGVTIATATGLPEDGTEVQRRAYNIITFTADKLYDDGSVPENHVPVTQANYVVQQNDVLKRSWAQRMGFGRVNAYRAVAHAIRNKGAYSYSSSQNLSFAYADGSGDARGYINEKGKLLMHFGSWKNSTTAVLVGGGVSLPVAGEYHNNHGVTSIEGTGTVLTVTSNCVLAIDGIVTTANVAGGNRIQTSGSGRILMTGMLSNVEIAGNLRLSDLYVQGENGGTGCVWAGDASTSSELYGKVTLVKDGMFFVNTGLATMMPGSLIHMSGSKNVVVKSGGTLRMKYASGITRSTTQSLIVQAGSTLMIEEGAHVELFCHVVLEAGAKMEIGTGAVVKIDQFTIETGATLTCKPDSYTVLESMTSDKYICRGQMIVEGTGNTLTKISGRNLNCCQFVCPTTCLDDIATAYITVEGPTGQLTVKNNVKADLLVTPAIRSGAVMMIETNATVTFNRFTVNPNGTFICSSGSTISINNTLNFCAGKLFVYGTANNRVKIYGRRTICSGDVPGAVIKPSNIIGIGSLQNIEHSLLHLEYADISNVKIIAQNIATDPIRHCNFSADRTLFKTAMLSMKYSRPQYAYHPKVDEVTITDCSFQDEALASKDPRPSAKYYVSGIDLSGFKGLVKVANSSFRYLNYALKTAFNNQVELTECRVTTCNRGVFDDGSALTLCSNLFNDVDFGSAFNFTKMSRQWHNVYSTTNQASILRDCALHNYRGNTLYDFVEGINVMKGIANMTKRWAGFKDGYQMNGRNVIGTPPLIIQPPTSNPFWNQNNIISISDIAIKDEGLPYLPCGYNDMAMYTVYHIKSEYTTTLSVQYNYWKDEWIEQVRKTPNVTVTGTPLYTSDVLTTSCTAMTSYDNCTLPLKGCIEDANTNDGSWLTLVPTDTLLDDFFDDARIKLLDTTMDRFCRREKAFDAVQAAALDDSSFAKLTLLKHDFDIVGRDTNAGEYLRTTAYMLRGEVFERLQEPDSAIVAYREITDHFPTSVDSLAAAWRIHAIAVEQSDTTYGDVYDSAMAVYDERVVEDMRRMAPGAGGYPKHGEAEGTFHPKPASTTGCALMQNIPNPFSTETTIGYSIDRDMKVKLSVSDCIGNPVAVLVDMRQKVGSYDVPFSTVNLPAGLYIYRLETETGVLSRTMLVLK